MAQLENIEKIENRLWSAADTLRTNSNYASNEYFMPVMGLVFLRHAYSRFLNSREGIVKTLPSRGGKTRELCKEDFSQKGAIFLNEKSQYNYLVSLPKGSDIVGAVINAMELIEKDYTNLKDQLPKTEYRELDDETLRQLLLALNPEELKKASGDIFGRIYEYFLTKFADLKAHDGGEFFTPVSLVQLIANVIEPNHGKIFDPACGSGGMFVQSAHFVERMKQNPNELLTFYGLEKNPTTIRLAKMNLAVHGLEGNIQKAITYYEDHESNIWNECDFVMANPPFNVDEVDAEKIKSDRNRRLPFGLPGVNKKGKVSNGNYLWISYFYSYLNKKGRAGFVMSSQAASAGNDEAKVRESIVKTGDVDVMIDIRGNFFYTRSVPCQLWFFNKNKPEKHKDKVLMLDARNVFRQVTRKIYDFSPEQLKNLTSIIWLYRGEYDRFNNLVNEYEQQILNEYNRSFEYLSEDNEKIEPVSEYTGSLNKIIEAITPYSTTTNIATETFDELLASQKLLSEISKKTDLSVLNEISDWAKETIRLTEHSSKTVQKLIDTAEKEHNAKEHELWNSGLINGTRRNSLKKILDQGRKNLVEQLKLVRYFYRHHQWLTTRFPERKLKDIEGLVKLVSIEEIEANDWSLSPGRYVGVAPEEIDEDFDFEEKMSEIHAELSVLNEEAVELAARITQNFEELGI